VNTLLKNNFWVINLVGIALVALMVAGAVNDVVGGKLFAVPKAPTLEPATDIGGSQVLALGRVAKDERAAQDLANRRIFNLDKREGETIVEAETEEPTEEGPIEPPDGKLEETTLALDLVGTMVAAKPSESMATMQVEGANKIAWIGSEFLNGKAKIIKIAPRHVVIQEESKYTVVSLWAKAPKPGRPGVRPSARPSLNKPISGRAKPSRPKAGPSLSDRTQRTTRIREGVKKTGAYDYQVSRSMIDEELKDMGRLQSEARVVPHYKNQKYEGFKLVGVRPGSLYRALGIRSGDVIKSVNGTVIDNPGKALELFNQLQNSSNISIDVERRGQPKTLGYAIN
jgi:type II secretion system protein C